MDKGKDEKSDSDESHSEHDKSRPKKSKQESISKTNVPEPRPADKEAKTESDVKNGASIETAEANQITKNTEESVDNSTTKKSDNVTNEDTHEMLKENNVQEGTIKGKESIPDNDTRKESTKEPNEEVISTLNIIPSKKSTHQIVIEDKTLIKIKSVKSVAENISRKDSISSNKRRSERESIDVVNKEKLQSSPEENKEMEESHPKENKKRIENLPGETKERVESRPGETKERVESLPVENGRTESLPDENGRTESLPEENGRTESLPEENKEMTEGLPLPEENKEMTEGLHLLEENKEMTEGLPLPEENKEMTEGLPLPEENKEMTEGLPLPEENKEMTEGLHLPEENKEMTEGLHLPEENKEMTEGLPLPEENNEMTEGLTLPEENKEMTEGLSLPDENKEMTEGLPLPEDNSEKVNISDENSIPDENKGIVKSVAEKNTKTIQNFPDEDAVGNKLRRVSLLGKELRRGSVPEKDLRRGSVPGNEIGSGSIFSGLSASGAISQLDGKYLGAGAIAYSRQSSLPITDENKMGNQVRRNTIPQRHSNFKRSDHEKLMNVSTHHPHAESEQHDHAASKAPREKSKESVKSDNTIERMLSYRRRRRHNILEDNQELIHLTHDFNPGSILIPSNEEIMRLRRLSKLSHYALHGQDSKSERSSRTTNSSRNNSEHHHMNKGHENDLGTASMTDLANFLQSHMNRGRFDKEMKEEEEEADAFAKSPAWRRGLILLLIGLTIIWVGHVMITIYLFNVPEKYEHPYACTTPNCKRMSKWLKEAMNTKVNPCDDFYEFSCGGFMKKYPSGNALTSKVSANKMLYTSGLLFDYNYHPSLGKFLKRVKTYPTDQILPFYQGCMDMDERNKLGIKPFINLLSQLRLLRLPLSNANPDSRNIARIMGRIYKKTNRLFFINFDDLQFNFIRLKIPRPPQELLMTPTKIYEQSIRKVFTLLQKDLLIEDEKEIDTIVYLVMRFEGQLTAVQSRSATALIFGFPHRMANEIKVPENLHSNYNRFIGKFLWEDLLAELYDYAPGSYDNYTIFYNVMMSAMEDKEERYFTIFIQYLIRKTPFYTIFRFFQWNLLKIFGFDLTEDIQNIMLNIYRNQGKSVTERCFRSVFFNLHVLAAERYTQMVDNRTQRFMEMDEMVTEFKRTFTEVLMGGSNGNGRRIPGTIIHSLLKTAETIQFVREPVDEVMPFLQEFYRGLKVNRTTHFRNVIQARTIKTRNDLLWAKHIPPYNKWTSGTYALADVTITTSKHNSGLTMRNLHFPIAASMEPYTGNDLPILNYAGFGFWIISQNSLYHAMEDFLADGLKQRKEFEPRFVVRRQKYIEAEALKPLECVFDAFKNIESPLFPGIKNNPMTPLSRIKTVADVFGLEFFLLAMERLKNNPKVYPRYQILPGLEKYTPDQLLFLAITRHACTSTSRKNKLHFIQHGPPLFELRIRGSLRNSEYFAKTWNCPTMTYMNPKKKCKLFTTGNSQYNMSDVIYQLFHETKDWINDPYTRAAFPLLALSKT